MRSPSFTAAVLVTTSMLTSLSSAHGGNATYTLKNDLSYKNFFNAFEFFSGPDPTNGFVKYQDVKSAISNGYVGYLDDTKSVYLGVDYTNEAPEGRPSVRAVSNMTFNQGLFVADVRHMPASTCGSWPAMWMLGVGADGNATWPEAGEVDILEGVNDYENNAVTLHTSAGCSVDNTTSGGMGQADGQNTFLGSMATDNCDVNAKGQDKNQGCSIRADDTSLPSYGTNFNAAGGGVYAMEWTDKSISVWFIPRNSSVFSTTFSSNSTKSLDPSTFGTPLAKFQGSGCDFSTRFNNMQIIFNTAFCGDWAGRIWDDSCAKSTGVATCQEYVQKNPQAFEESYWEIGGLWWFEKADGQQAKTRALHVRKPGRPHRW